MRGRNERKRSPKPDFDSGGGNGEPFKVPDHSLLGEEISGVRGRFRGSVGFPVIPHNSRRFVTIVVLRLCWDYRLMIFDHDVHPVLRVTEYA